MRANDVRRGSRVLCPRGGFLCNIFVCFSLFLWFAVAMVLFPLHLSSLFFYICLSFIFFPTVFASPSPCSLHFLPPNFHHLIPVTGSSAEQCCATWPRLFFGRVMYEWLALTSLQAQRHSNSVLPGLLFLVLSFTASPSFLFLCILH